MYSLNRRKIIATLLFSLPTAAVLAFGLSYRLRRSCNPLSKLTICTFLACFLVLTALFIVTTGKESGKSRACFKQNKITKFVDRHTFITSFIVLLLAWLPYYLASFPGLYVYDAIPQTTRAIGLGIIDSWHPLIHTYWMSGLMMLGKALFNSYDFGFSLYTTSQYILFAALLSCSIARLNKLWQTGWKCLLSIAFFALFPLFPVMAVSSTKDTIFSASFALCAIELIVFYEKEEPSRLDICIFFLSGLLVSLFRNNGVYALVITLLYMMISRRKRKTTVATSFILILTSFILAIALPKAISQRTSTSAEALSVPIQQISRVAINHYQDFTESDKEELNTTIPGWQKYLPLISDSVKFADGTSKAIEENKATFFKLWFKFLIRYPSEYLDAFFGLINCWVCPIEQFEPSGTYHPYLEYDSYEIAEDGVLVRHQPTGDEYMGYDTPHVVEVHRNSLLPSFEPTMRTICYTPFWTNNLGIRALTSTALPLIILYYSLCKNILQKKKSMLCSQLFLALYALTCFLGPVYLARYALPFYAAYPTILTFVSPRLFTTEKPNRYTKASCLYVPKHG